MDLHRLVAAGESDCVEFKKSTSELNGACESLCAFLNQGCEGIVLIGVSGGKLTGQDVSDRTQQEIANALKDFEPRVKIDWKIFPLENSKQVILFKIAPNWDLIPFTFKGRPFWRIGTTTSIMSRDHYLELIREQIEKTHPYETFPARDYSLGQIDVRKLNNVIEVGIRLGRLTSEARGKPEEILEKLQLLAQGKLKNAAAILFGKNFSFMPQCCVQMARFKGTEKGEFLDNKQLTGHAFDVFEEALMFMQRHIPLWGKIEKDSPYRKEDYLIPIDAFREALVNAICHRDYSDYSGGLFVAIYDDRMEIDNIGSLPRGMKAEDLKKRHTSKPRNKLIADMFYYYGLIERWGQGTQKIVKLCKNANLQEPEFVVSSHWFKIIFRAEIKAPGLPQNLILPARKQPLSSRQAELLRLFAQTQPLSFKEIQAKYPDTSRRTLQDALLKLKKRKFLNSNGQGVVALWFANPVKPE